MRSRRIACALACLAAGAALLPALAQGAASGRVKGKLTGVTVPAGGRGSAVVQAVRLDTGVIAAARRLPASGAYSLRLPRGAYALLGTVVEPGAGVLVTRSASPLTLRAGQRRSVSLARRAAAARAIEVRDFTGAAGKPAVLNRGLPVLLQTAIATSSGGCATTVVANARQRALLPGAAALRRSPNADRGTTVRRALVAADVVVTGTLTPGAGVVGYEIRIADARTGAMGDVQRGELPLGDAFSAQVSALGARILKLTCAPAAAPTPATDPAVISGSFSGDADYTTGQDGLPIRLRWSGTVDLVRHAPDAAGVVVYLLRSGTATVTLSGRTGSCAVDGTTTVDLIATNPGGAPPALTVDPGPAPAYRLVLQSAIGEVSGVKSGCNLAADNGERFTWPLLGVGLAFTPDPLTAASRSSFSASFSGRPSPTDPVHTWLWSLTGQ